MSHDPKLTPRDGCPICEKPLGDLAKTAITERGQVVHQSCTSKSLSGRLTASGAWPPDYVGRPGQRPLRRFTAITWLRTLWPGFAQLFDGEVPEEFWSLKEGIVDREVAIVACPCGEEPEVGQNALAICHGEDCGRAFLRIGDRIKVATFDPAELAAATTQ